MEINYSIKTNNENFMAWIKAILSKDMNRENYRMYVLNHKVTL